MEFSVRPHSALATLQQREQILANPGFGEHFSDHMIRISWTAKAGWHNAEVLPYGPISLMPAAKVLHYGQEIFEGMKAYRHADNSIWTFRPEKNAARFNRSAQRLALPTIPEDLFLQAVTELVRIDHEWVPAREEESLYLRPFLIATDPTLGIKAPQSVDFYCIASPSGAYFTGGATPITVWASRTFSRAGRGGTGAAKCGGNYAASMLGKLEALEHGANEVCFLDAETLTYIDELSGMNVFAVYKDGRIRTPALTGSILEGVTRDSIMRIASDLGLKPEESRLDFRALMAEVAAGEVTEFFACGTAAVVNPIGGFFDGDDQFQVANGQPGHYTIAIRNRLLDIQYGRVRDEHNWMRRLC